MRFSTLFSVLGPGIVWAATSIGVSHIVQATRAGADFGFLLLAVVIFAHLVKYPFFLFGPKYAALTGKSLLDGYKAVGNWAFYAFLLLTFITMFLVQAGVTVVTSALALNLFGDALTLSQWAAVVLVIVCGILLVGHYKVLSSLMKWMMLVLVVCSIIALAATVVTKPVSFESAPLEQLWAPVSIAFIVALVGWMPTSIEVSVWHSLWTLSRHKNVSDQSSEKATKAAVFDFNLGYATSLVLSVIFLSLGSFLMFSEQLSFANNAAVFAKQLIGIYSSALGDWSYPLMATVAFIALFSTTFAVSDGFPQVWQRAYVLSTDKSSTTENKQKKIYAFAIGLLAIGSWLIIHYFSRDIKQLLDFVTTVSFVSAPIFAWLNYQVIKKAEVDEKHKPQGLFKLYTLVSLGLITLFSLYFVYWRFF